MPRAPYELDPVTGLPNNDAPDPDRHDHWLEELQRQLMDQGSSPYCLRVEHSSNVDGQTPLRVRHYPVPGELQHERAVGPRHNLGDLPF